MGFGGRYGLGIACIIGAGAAAVSMMALLGALLPHAANDTARNHLLLATLLPVFGLVITALFAGAAVLFEAAKLGRFWTLAPQLASSAVCLTLLLYMTHHAAVALGEWFDDGVPNSEEVDWLIQTGLAVALFAVLSGAIAVLVQLTRRRIRTRPSGDLDPAIEAQQGDVEPD